MPSRGALGILAAAALALAGCGDDESGVAQPASAGAPGSGGALVWLVAEPPAQLDPLGATSRSSQLVTRQIHEPLVASLAGPFGDVRRLRGLAVSWRSSADQAVWRFVLREGVRFQDGTPFNAGAVVANAERWRTTRQGRGLMPDLFAADAPRPDLVRFVLERPDPDFPDRLADPRTGIVSPRALEPSTGTGARLTRPTRTGTGAFEVRERDADGVLVARNLSWWGTERGLGPALDQVEFRVVEDAGDRVELLTSGDAQVADSLGPAEAADARRDPLLEVIGGPGAALGLQRSVRGITSARDIPSLAGVWVTRVGAG